MKSFLIILFALLTVQTAHAAPWLNFQQNIKLPTQEVLQPYTWAVPAAASTTLLKSGQALSNAAATTITSFSAQPDFARNITLTPTGTTASVQAGTAVVSGTNIYGKTISENFTIANQQSSATTGSKAFLTVSSVVFPQASSTGATLSIGAGTKLGIPHCLATAGKYVFSEYGGAYESTRGTMAISTSAVESNTFIANGSLDAAHDVTVHYIQNYRCFGN